MTGIKKRLGSILGPEGRVPQIAGGVTTTLDPQETAQVDLIKTGDAQYRLDVKVPRGLHGDPTAVANFGQAMALEIDSPKSAGRTALNAVSTEIADQRVTAANIPGQVHDQVAEVVSGNPAVVDSVAQRVLSTQGVVTGAATTLEGGDTAWAQTTDPIGGVAKRLPLGYRADGHLDNFARRVWLEDLDDARMTLDPEYRMVRMTPEQKIIYAEKWDGTVIIPGLIQPRGQGHPAPIYADVPNAGGIVLPIKADTTRLALWGSSTLEAGRHAIRSMATGHGMEIYAGGKSGEIIEHHAARMGAIPAQLEFPDNTIPASGPVSVTITNVPLDRALLAYDGSVATSQGEHIQGTLSYSFETAQYTFTRAEPGEPLAVDAGVEFIPTDGVQWRNATTLIQAGKNNLTRPDTGGDPESVAEKTIAMVRHHAALQKRVLVLGQFVNMNTPPVSEVRDRTYISDGILKESLGPLFVDVKEWIISGQVWEDAGVSPTTEDLEQQALGNLPPSIAANEGHFNTTGNTAYAALIERTMSNYGWISS